MNSICLSVAPNLRCQGLTRLENIILLVPPSIELVFSLTLALTNTSVSGRKRWILVLDGVSFFLLALTDFFAHILTQVSSQVNVFRIFDLVVAGASFLPILAYTLFLFLFSRSAFVKLLPTRFSRVTNLVLFAIIPLIIAFNELGSLLGISHMLINSPNQAQGLEIGFPNPNLQRISLFFSSVTLALLTLFQAALFTLSFIRVARAFLDERRIEFEKEDPDAQEQIHLFRGLGWLAVGLKLGAIETVVGFANVSFAVVITRRALRLFGRGAMIIGVIKGLNVIEDFVKFETDVKARRGGSRRSKRLSRVMISNPRNSTFRELSPRATSFHAAQWEKRGARLGPSPLSRGNLTTAINSSTRKERVTVQYDGRTPPVLQMRFSTLDIDVPPVPLVEKRTLPTVMEDLNEDQQSTYGSILPSHTPRPSQDTSIPQHYNARRSGTSLHQSQPSETRRTISVASDSLEVVREMATRFPGLPPRVVPGRTPLIQRRVDTDPDAEWRLLSRNRSLQRRQLLEQADSSEQTSALASDISPVNSIKRKPPPSASTPVEIAQEFSDTTAQGEHVSQSGYAATTDDPVSYYSSDDEDDDSISLRSRLETPDLTRVPTLDTTPTTPATLGLYPEASAERTPGRLATRVMAIENKTAQVAQLDTAALEERRQRRQTQLRRELRVTSAYDEVFAGHKSSGQEIEVSWMQNDPLTEIQSKGRSGYPLVPTDVDEEDVSEAVLDEAWRRAGLTRIKSLSQVRVHTTPRAEQTFDIRGSLFAVEEGDMEMPESPRARISTSSASLKRPARSDSGVLGEEDRKLVRQGIYV